MLNDINKPKPAAPCACCNGASETEVWGIRVCYACHSAWMADDRFGSGVINAFLGTPDTVEGFTPEAHTRYCAEAAKRTRAWVAERRTARAA